MSDQDLQTGFESYKELESDTEEMIVAEPDDRPVSSQPFDWTISTLRDKHERGQIDLQPHYQREYVWDMKPELPSRLIESLLLQIPIPPIYFGKMSGGRMEVIDGQQRLTTLIKFVRNEFQLKKLERIGSINGKFFRDLSEEEQEQVLDAPIRSIVIDAGTNQNLRYEVFERLNRGSMALNEQEIRNCAYRGAFCDLLVELEQDANWRRVRGTTEPERRFIEREMILRYFAFSNRLNYYAGNLKRFLNEYMSKYAPSDQESLESMGSQFRQTMQNVYAVFGSNSGRLYSIDLDNTQEVNGKWEPKFSISALDIQASALSNQHTGKVQTAAEQIREAYFLYVLTNPSVRRAISMRPASTQASKIRWTDFKHQVDAILAETKVEPRFFSYEFRQQLFNKESMCEICKNQIHSFDDCTVDHIMPYSKGGRTVPENAQLTHRSCNARKLASLPIEEEESSEV